MEQSECKKHLTSTTALPQPAVRLLLGVTQSLKASYLVRTLGAEYCSQANKRECKGKFNL